MPSGKLNAESMIVNLSETFVRSVSMVFGATLSSCTIVTTDPGSFIDIIGQYLSD